MWRKLDRFDIAGAEAEAVLAEDADTLDAEHKATLKMTAAVGALRRGNQATRFAVWRSWLKEPSDLDAEGRGWAWRSILSALPADDPEARAAAQHSADAFLEAGKKDEAGKSLMRLANILLDKSPPRP